MGHNNQNWVHGDEWICPTYQRGPYCKDCLKSCQYELNGTVLFNADPDSAETVVRALHETFKWAKSDKVPIDFTGLDEKKINAIRLAFPNHNLIKFAWNELYMLRAQCDHTISIN